VTAGVPPGSDADVELALAFEVADAEPGAKTGEDSAFVATGALGAVVDGAGVAMLAAACWSAVGLLVVIGDVVGAGAAVADVGAV